MPQETLFAFKIRSLKGRQQTDHIVTASDLAQAAEDAQRRLTSAGARLVRVEFLGEALSDLPGPEPVGLAAPAGLRCPAPKPVSRSSVNPPTRIDQLIELLSRRPEPLHLNEIALGLGISRKNANSIVMRAGRAGLVRRVGNRSGKVELTN